MGNSRVLVRKTLFALEPFPESLELLSRKPIPEKISDSSDEHFLFLFEFESSNSAWQCVIEEEHAI